MDHQMLAVQFEKPGEPSVLRPVSLPTPRPGPNEVRVRAMAIGVSSADMLIRKGTYKWMPPLPAIPGNELAGVVDMLGPGVSGIEVGQEVLVSSRELPRRGGCYAEFVCVPPRSVFRLPKEVTAEQAVALPNYQLAGALLYESGVQRPKKIAVFGASGGVGLALAQLARADGIEAIGIVSTEDKRAFVQAAGVSRVALRRDDVVQQVKELAGGRGVDVVYAHAGRDFVKYLDMLEPLGTLLSFSILGGPMPDADIFADLRARLGLSLGVRVYSIHTMDDDPRTRRALMERAIHLVAERRISPLAPTVYGLRDAALAHEHMEAGTTLGKMILVPESR